MSTSCHRLQWFSLHFLWSRDMGSSLEVVSKVYLYRVLSHSAPEIFSTFQIERNFVEKIC